jgi:hypothetical protein
MGETLQERVRSYCSKLVGTAELKHDPERTLWQPRYEDTHLLLSFEPYARAYLIIRHLRREEDDFKDEQMRRCKDPAAMAALSLY